MISLKKRIKKKQKFMRFWVLFKAEWRKDRKKLDFWFSLIFFNENTYSSNSETLIKFEKQF